MRCGTMSISCHFRDCKALLVASLTHVSGAVSSVQTFTFAFIPCDSVITFALERVNWLSTLMMCDCLSLQPTMRHVVHDGEGHVVASKDDDVRSRWRGSVADWSPAAAAAAAAAADVADDGVSTVRFQELYSRASRHLVRVTASRVDALGNHSSPFGKTFSTRQSTFAVRVRPVI